MPGAPGPDLGCERIDPLRGDLHTQHLSPAPAEARDGGDPERLVRPRPRMALASLRSWIKPQRRHHAVVALGAIASSARHGLDHGFWQIHTAHAGARGARYLVVG